MASSDRKLCMIPGPVEFDEQVLTTLKTPATSHLDPQFVSQFSNTLKLLRKVFQANESSQPVIIAGSGTLAWDVVGSNLIEPGENALVINTGVFGDWFGECLEVYGANVTHIRSEFGNIPSFDEIAKALTEKKYKLVTITHVDTSTGVLTPIKEISALIHEKSPESLIAIDGVCSVAAEEIKQSEWGLDVVLTASQKAIGVPPGLALLVLSERATKVALEKSKPTSYFASLKKWIPIMRNYEAKKNSYFATPPVQLVLSLEESLKQILAEGLNARFAKHVTESNRIKDAVEAEGLKLVPKSREIAAHSLSAVYFPEGANGPEFVKTIVSDGIMIAGGLHPVHGSEYFRIGHMNISATRNESNHHIDSTIDVIVKTIKSVKA